MSVESLESMEAMGMDAVFTVLVYGTLWWATVTFVRTLVLEPIGWLVVDVRVARKWAVCVSEAVEYAGFAVVGWYLFPSYVWSPSQWPDIWYPQDWHMPSLLANYYLAYAGRYLGGVALLVMEPPRNDHNMMLLHHVVTAALVLHSYLAGWWRVGVVVMALFDPSDVLLQLAKACKYMGGFWWGLVADSLFAGFVLSFGVLRLALYPWLCWHLHTWPRSASHVGAVLMLDLILRLNVAWAQTIWRVLLRTVRTGDVVDERDDD